MIMSTSQATAYLTKLGWPGTMPLAQSLRAFEAGYTYDVLPLTGKLDEKNSTALAAASLLAQSGRGTASVHFSFREFACGCGGAYGCDVMWPTRELILGLERLRTAFYPSGLTVVSGCRCTRRNKEAGGALLSQHLYGSACDVKQTVTAAQVAKLGVFSGIGTYHGKVCHVDVRKRYNPTYSTPTHPAIFNEG